MQYWFKAKRYGYGAGLPIAWQGWLLLGLYFGAAFILALGVPILFGAAYGALMAVGAIVVLTAPFLVICMRRTEGGWRWRWGED